MPGKTLLIDIDGTVVYQPDDFLDAIRHLRPLQALPGVVEALTAGIRSGDVEHIIFTTARPHIMRGFTERELHRLGIPFDILVMGCGNGPRVLINNLAKGSGDPMASAINVALNAGFDGLSF